MSDYLLLHYDNLDEMWHDAGLFKTTEDAEKEIEALIKIMPAVIKRNDFAIIPNNGEAQSKYRPLDFGDRIVYSTR